MSVDDDDDVEDEDVVVVVVVVVVVAAFFPARLLFPLALAFSFSFAFFFMLDTRTPMATTVVPARMLSANISCRKTQRARPQARPLPESSFFSLSIFRIANCKGKADTVFNFLFAVFTIT